MNGSRSTTADRAMETAECDEEDFLIFLTFPRLAPGGTTAE
jgi:hypothetical protein